VRVAFFAAGLGIGIVSQNDDFEDVEILFGVEVQLAVEIVLELENLSLLQQSLGLLQLAHGLA
jgi:hypothetical protein